MEPTGITAEASGERLNDEPVIFRGYTDSEFVVAMVLAVSVSLPAGLFGGILLGRIAIGIGLSMASSIALVVLGASVYQNWKRGRPLFWLQQRAAIALVDLGLTGARLARRRAVMSVGRERRWP